MFSEMLVFMIQEKKTQNGIVCSRWLFIKYFDSNSYNGNLFLLFVTEK